VSPLIGFSIGQLGITFYHNNPSYKLLKGFILLYCFIIALKIPEFLKTVLSNGLLIHHSLQNLRPQLTKDILLLWVQPHSKVKTSIGCTVLDQSNTQFVSNTGCKWEQFLCTAITFYHNNPSYKLLKGFILLYCFIIAFYFLLELLQVRTVQSETWRDKSLW
jgi:hypothetical protein